MTSTASGHAVPVLDLDPYADDPVKITADSVSAVMLSELFPTGVRYTGVSASYQLAQTVGSGLGPMIAASLFAAAGGTDTTLIAVYIGLVAVVSLVVLLRMKETAGTSLRSTSTDPTPEIDTTHSPVDA